MEMLPMGPRVVPPGRSKCLFDRGDHSLLLDVGAQLEDILFAGHLELVGETKVFDLDLEKKGTHSTQNRI